MPGENLLEQALRHEHGRGVKQDFHKAFRLYCLAVEQGHSDAYYHLGWMYFNQRGVERNPARAAWWFALAAAAGDDHAGRMLQLLDGIEPAPDRDCSLLSKDEPSRQEIESWVRRWAPSYGLDPALVLAVIAAESAFDPRAHSGKDARGLMQLIPATARRFGVQEIWDPVQNMRGGMAYLKWLLQRFDGEVKLALAAYNAGEGAVENYQGVPPYRETRNYVKRIARLYPRQRHPVEEGPLLSAGGS
ncbi:MAG: transglycosylase SLT domain-containing protein [Sedimenticola sp.]|nr:transglycosylase SLT domain-containing protein [Sedimenticola sp.]